MPSTIIELTEYIPALLPLEKIPLRVGEMLWRYYSSQVAVEFPSPKTGGQWQLTAQGWVGYIPLTPDLSFSLQPRVKLSNLFRMLEYAYYLHSFHWLEGLVESDSLAEFYERLAHILAHRILERGRQGFYRAYVSKSEQLPYVRGRVDLQRAGAVKPGQVRLNCRYEQFTADIADNQILAWTLACITRSGLCTERSLPTVRRAYRRLQDLATLRPYSPRDCIGRRYHRLNQDYEPLHALCRFFLEYSGPRPGPGEHRMLPFLVNMPRLYERFVAEWLQRHLPSEILLRSQERVDLAGSDPLHFEIDLTLYEGRSGLARCALDTKYKVPTAPATDDIAQVVTYAQAKNCHEAILVYPTPLARPLDTWVGDIRVRTLTFSLDSDLEQAGQQFLQDLQLR